MIDTTDGHFTLLAPKIDPQMIVWMVSCLSASKQFPVMGDMGVVKQAAGCSMGTEEPPRQAAPAVAAGPAT